MTPRGVGACEHCGAALDEDQRYCLNCGNRVGAPGAQLTELKRRALEPASPVRGEPVPEPAVASPVGRQVSAPRLPTPRISALLVLVFLGFGTLLGSAAGSRNGALAADAGQHLRLLVPPPKTSGTSAKSESESSGPPEAEAETTPEPAGEKAGAGGSKTTSTAKEEEPAEEEEAETEKPAKNQASVVKVATKLPSFKHVFVIMLSDEPYAAVFGPESKARYVTGTLEKKGELLLRYDAVAHEQLANEIALVSGQGPTAQTAANCPTYSAISPGGAGAGGQVLGSGCVYPASTPTIGSELTAKQLTWRAYVEGMGETGTSAGPCAHPSLGAADTTLEGSAYATFRDPFAYFEAETASPGCPTDLVGLDKLAGDLAASGRTPNLSYIVPDRCHDGAPAACAPGAASGPGDANRFLETVVPEILSSKAYKNGGLLVITTDEAPSGGEFADSSSCCGQPAYPNLAPVEGHGKGGGAVGALLISGYVPAGKTSSEQYNHFSLLRTIEDIFGLKHLGYAGVSAVKPLSPSLFTVPTKG